MIYAYSHSQFDYLWELCILKLLRFWLVKCRTQQSDISKYSPLNKTESTFIFLVAYTVYANDYISVIDYTEIPSENISIKLTAMLPYLSFAIDWLFCTLYWTIFFTYRYCSHWSINEINIFLVHIFIYIVIPLCVWGQYSPACVYPVVNLPL